MDRRTVTLLGATLITVLAVGFVVAQPRPAPSPFTGMPAPASGAPATEPSVPPSMATADVYGLFAAPGAARIVGEPAVVSVMQAGDLVLPSGRVIAADVYFFGAEPLTRVVPAGRHPVSVLEADIGPGRDRRIAAAMVRFDDGDPVSWELAVVPGQDISTLRPDEFFGYGVDSGTGCFASAEAATVLADPARFDAYAEEVQRRMFPTPEEARPTVDVVVDPDSGANVVGFASGFGDGLYPSWFGLDAAGEPLVLLTDFRLLDAPAS